MPTPQNRLLYDFAPLLKEKALFIVRQQHRNILSGLIQQRLDESSWGEDTRSELMGLQSQCRWTGDELFAKELQKMQKSIFNANKKDLEWFKQSTLKFKNILPKLPRFWVDAVRKADEKVKKYSPTYDDTAPIADIKAQLEAAEQQLLEELDALMPPKPPWMYQKCYTDASNRSDPWTVMNYGVKVRLVYAFDNKTPVRLSTVIFWHYEPDCTEVESDLAETYAKKNSTLPLAMALTDGEGYVNLPPPSGAHEQGYFKQNGGFHYYHTVLMKNPYHVVFRHKRSIESYRNDYLRRHHPHGHDPKADVNSGPEPQYAPPKVAQAIATEIKRSNVQHRQSKLTRGLRFGQNHKYGFFVYPAGMGHFVTKDVRQLAKQDVGDGQFAAWSGVIPAEQDDATVEVPVHCTLPEWDRLLQEQLMELIIPLDARNKLIKKHSPNLTRLATAKRVVELHQDYSVEAHTNSNTEAHTKFIETIQATIDEYIKLKEADLKQVKADIETKSEELLVLLKNPAFSKEFARYMHEYHDTDLEILKKTVELTPAGPDMEVETAWTHIFQTVSDIVFALEDAGKRDEVWEFLGEEAFARMAVNIDNPEDYAPHEMTVIDLNQSYKNNPHLELQEKFLDEATKDDVAMNHDNPLGFVPVMFEEGISPAYGMLNKLPGPPSILQALVFAMGDKYLEFIEKNAMSAKPMHLRISYPLIYMTGLAVRRGNWDKAEYTKFKNNLVIYFTTRDQNLKRQLQRNLMDNADVSNALGYRAFCVIVNGLFAYESLRMDAGKAYKAWKGERALEYLLKEGIITGGSYGYTLSLGGIVAGRTLMAASTATNVRNLGQKLMAGSDKLATRLGYGLAIITSIVSLAQMVDHIRKGDEAAAAEDLATAISAGGTFIAQVMIQGRLATLAIIPGLNAWVMGITAAVALGLFAYQLFTEETEAKILKLLKSQFKALEPTWNGHDSTGRVIDLRSEELKKHMSNFDYYAEKINWDKCMWRAAIPLYLNKISPAGISSITNFDRDYPHPLASKYRRYRRLNPYLLIRYMESLKKAIAESHDPDALVFASGKTYEQVAKELAQGEFTPNRDNPENLDEVGHIWGLIELDPATYDMTHWGDSLEDYR